MQAVPRLLFRSGARHAMNIRDSARLFTGGVQNYEFNQRSESSQSQSHHLLPFAGAAALIATVSLGSQDMLAREHDSEITYDIRVQENGTRAFKLEPAANPAPSALSVNAALEYDMIRNGDGSYTMRPCSEAAAQQDAEKAQQAEKFQELVSTRPTSLLKRTFASVIDHVAMIAVMQVLRANTSSLPAGSHLLVLPYALLRDAFNMSIGKRLLGLETITTADHDDTTPCWQARIRASVTRNLPQALILFGISQQQPEHEEDRKNAQKLFILDVVVQGADALLGKLMTNSGRLTDALAGAHVVHQQPGENGRLGRMAVEEGSRVVKRGRDTVAQIEVKPLSQKRLRVVEAEMLFRDYDNDILDQRIY
eukprot:TRINITY_DN3436_c0_g4_i1.p1 TRINITY_DN3436_c0_g4~~TRINITY_DN3436_c0_g4_i1.p1  ORF type:complete len:366 (+),score=79.36 TRINITY_DN3436_c0_g4_i1:55-1152(+)